jgi:predicted GH43/DUF377 family glycosyl hydrolase
MNPRRLLVLFLTPMLTAIWTGAATADPVLADKSRPGEKAVVPDWVVYPERDWQTITPAEAGLDLDKWNAWVARQTPSGNDSWGQNPQYDFGVVVTRGGYLLKVFGNAECKIQSVSVGKAFTSFALQLAIDEGLIKSADDPIRNYWTGEGQLDAEQKRMDRGVHPSLTFFHLHAMRGGFPISNGWSWSRKQDVPPWAQWTGDPTADNYAHIEPGKENRYSSGGRWRLSQALTGDCQAWTRQSEIAGGNCPRERSWIGYARSADGVAWRRMSPRPVISPDAPWEKVAVMCPHVVWDERNRVFRMWYSGGEQYEPDAIGYATSPNGQSWAKHADNPVFQADNRNAWEQHKVTACQVVRDDDWHLMFYIGFRDEHRAQIGLARSRDGISHWERHPANPIISPGRDQWDHDACYKPFAIFDQDKAQWLLWYNGRRGRTEQIGLAIHPGRDLGFPAHRNDR